MNLMHPGQLFYKGFVVPHGLTQTDVAKALGVSESAVSRVLSGKSDISSDMALRISHVFGGDPESWMSLQAQYDLAESRKKLDFSGLRALKMQDADISEEGFCSV